MPHNQSIIATLHSRAVLLDSQAVLLRTHGDRDGAAKANIAARDYRDAADALERGEPLRIAA